ncbi:DUF397 domain-containing protein [Kitasatospora sp. NPDC087861]|uniref:DUF397 domain-containing protein n=1 Tax=Kitasatospora sp. NPDC087861 TaxID=3364070 RepID=UPI0037F6448C
MNNDYQVPAVDPESLTWFKARESGDQGACVEVAHVPDGGVFLRDSKDRSRPFHYYNAREWRAFLTAAKAGEFDPPSA